MEEQPGEAEGEGGADVAKEDRARGGVVAEEEHRMKHVDVQRRKNVPLLPLMVHRSLALVRIRLPCTRDLAHSNSLVTLSFRINPYFILGDRN